MPNIERLNPDRKGKYLGYTGKCGDLIWAILDVLSRKSRNNKQKMIEFKQNILKVLSVDSPINEEVLKIFEELLFSDENTKWILVSLQEIEWVKNTGLGKSDVFEEENEDLDEFAKKGKEMFITLSKRFVKYADSFYDNYVRIVTDYIHENKEIPNYKYVLKKIFCNYVARYIKKFANNFKFTEEDCKEGFGFIQEWLEDKGLDLELSDNIKQHFIKLCREKYPLAPKKDDFLFNNKGFRKDFIKFITSGLNEYLEESFNDSEKEWMKNVDKDIADCVDEDHRNSIITENMVLCCIFLIDWYINKWPWKDNAIGQYFKCIADQFEYDHLKNVEKGSTKNTLTPAKTEISIKEIFAPNTAKIGWGEILEEEENDLIKEAVSYINCENKKSIIKYITKLKIKGLPIKFYDLKRLYNLKEIPPQTESILIDQLGMDYEVEEEEIINEKKNSKENENKNEISNGIPTSEKIIIENPAQYLIDKLKSLGCVIDNELTAEKQIDEFCKNGSYRTVLINLMTNPKFGKVFIHKPGHITARSLRIGTTGWRILFEIRKDGNLHFVCFGNHDYYEDRLAKLK